MCVVITGHRYKHRPLERWNFGEEGWFEQRLDGSRLLHRASERTCNSPRGCFTGFFEKNRSCRLLLIWINTTRDSTSWTFGILNFFQTLKGFNGPPCPIGGRPLKAEVGLTSIFYYFVFMSRFNGQLFSMVKWAVVVMTSECNGHHQLKMQLWTCGGTLLSEKKKL